MPFPRDHTEPVELARTACRDLARIRGLRDAADARTPVTWVELPTDSDPDAHTAPALRIGSLGLVFVGERIVSIGTGSPSPHLLMDVVARADDHDLTIEAADEPLIRLVAADRRAAQRFVARFDRLRLTLAHYLAAQRGGFLHLVENAAHEHDQVGARATRHAAVLADALDSGLLALGTFIGLHPLQPSATRNHSPTPWIIGHLELGAACCDQIGITMNERIAPALLAGTRDPDLPFLAALVDLLALLRVLHEWELALIRVLPPTAFAERPADAQPLAASMVTTFEALPDALRRGLADVEAGREAEVKLDLEIRLPDWFEAWVAKLI